MRCRFCNETLHDKLISLGHQPPSNSLLTEEKLSEPETYYPLDVMICEKCGLAQLPEIKKASEIFKDDYPYYSSQSPSNVSHAKEYCDMILGRYPHIRKVLEIGSNDGYMLQWFLGKGCDVVGIDPARGPAEEANKRGIATWPAFFNSKMIRWEGKGKNQGYAAVSFWKPEPTFDLICGINVIAHQPDINDFVEGMKIALAPEGIITMEFPHLMRLIEGNQFDTIYHEHFNYFSLATLERIFEKHGLHIYDVDEIPEHGGSLRIYACHDENGQGWRWGGDGAFLQVIKDIKHREGSAWYPDFRHGVEQIRMDLIELLMKARRNKKVVCAYGAPAKGNTLLNYCGIRNDLIRFTVDRSPHKQGKYLPGSHIPVYPVAMIGAKKPDYILILPWNLKEEIMEQLKYVREWGCKFIIPIPRMEVI